MAVSEGVYMFRSTEGSGMFHLTGSLQNPESLCGHLKATTRLDGQAHRKYIYPFNGFDQKPRHKWCGKCRSQLPEVDTQ